MPVHCMAAGTNLLGARSCQLTGRNLQHPACSSKLALRITAGSQKPSESLIALLYSGQSQRHTGEPPASCMLAAALSCMRAACLLQLCHGLADAMLATIAQAEQGLLRQSDACQALLALR